MDAGVLLVEEWSLGARELKRCLCVYSLSQIGLITRRTKNQWSVCPQCLPFEISYLVVVSPPHGVGSEAGKSFFTRCLCGIPYTRPTVGGGACEA